MQPLIHVMLNPFIALKEQCVLGGHNCPLLETLCKPVAETLQLSSLQAPPTDKPPVFYQFLMLLETKWATHNFHTHSPHSPIQWQLAVTPLKLLFPKEPP